MSEEQIIKMYKQGYSFERIIATHIDELIRKSTTNYYGVKKKTDKKEAAKQVYAVIRKWWKENVK